jgi:hypothetical protein
MPQFSDEILDTFGRPKLSELTICGADDLPDLPDYSSFAINNHIFNLNHPNKSALHLHLQLAISRRTNSAGEEYRLARNHLLDYVEDLRIPEHRLKSYLLALTHFEQCIISIHQASELFNKTQSRVLNSPVEPLFKEDKDKGSDLERCGRLRPGRPAAPDPAARHFADSRRSRCRLPRPTRREAALAASNRSTRPDAPFRGCSLARLDLHMLGHNLEALGA